MRLDFTDFTGKAGYVDGEPGTNFGLRISGAEVLRLYYEHSWNLPFDIMAAGYGEDSDWVGLQHDDVAYSNFAIDASYDELEEQWGPFELSIGPTRKPTASDVMAANERGYYMEGGDFDVTNLTPQRALDIVQSRLEAVMAVAPHVWTAIAVLDTFIKQADDLEWGEPGDCWERIVNDPDISDEIGIETNHGYGLGSNAELLITKAKAAGLGRHYGDPHCIWCLQGN